MAFGDMDLGDSGPWELRTLEIADPHYLFATGFLSLINLFQTTSASHCVINKKKHKTNSIPV